MAILNGKEVFFTPLGGGGGIKDVIELPSDADAKDNTIYRLRSGLLLVNRIADKSYTVKCVDGLPEIGESASKTLYYNTQDNLAYGYVDSSISSKVLLSIGWYEAHEVLYPLGYDYEGVIYDPAEDARDNRSRILIGFILMTYKEGKWTALASTDWIDNNVPRYKAVMNEYTCKSYNHSAQIPGAELWDHYGFATSTCIPLDALRGCEISVHCNGYDDGGWGTMSLANASVTYLDGGYALTVSTYKLFYGCPDARVIVVTDKDKFNKTCNCDLESTGTYLSEVQRDRNQYTEYTKVTELRLIELKINNADLDLEHNDYLNERLAKLEAMVANLT